MSTTLTKYLTIAVVILGCTQCAWTFEEPTGEIAVLRKQITVGEPIVVDFIVRNEHDTPICSPAHNDIERALVEFTLRVYSENSVVARWGTSIGCVKGAGVIARFAETGECLRRLNSGKELRARKYVVLLVDPNGNPVMGAIQHGIALPPGVYTLVGQIPWGGSMMNTEPVEIRVVQPSKLHDRGAAKLVGQEFQLFMDTAIMGMNDMEASGSVKRILERFPDSVHAVLAQSRLLVLQADKLKSRYGTTDDQRETDKQLMIDVVSRIDEHLRADPDDPLALDLMDGKIHLLRRLEREDELRQAIDALAAKYPHSGRTRRAQDMWKQIHSNPNDRE